MRYIIVEDRKIIFSYAFSGDGPNDVYVWLGEQDPTEEEVRYPRLNSTDIWRNGNLEDPEIPLPQMNKWGYLGCGNASAYVPCILAKYGITDPRVIRKAVSDSFR